MKYQKNKARYLRRNQTYAEGLLWKLLKSRKFDNLKFRRQHPIDNYVVDFYCKEKNVIIEIDGPLHEDEEKKIRDSIRQKYIESKGYNILRFKEKEISGNTDNFLLRLMDYLKNC
jgi:very-short-patch-repair endonuclease